MLLIAIVLISLIFQGAAVFFSFRLIKLTGHTPAWLLLSLGIATMAVRRLITFQSLLFAPTSHGAADYSFDVIGFFGSAMMLAGVILITPIFLRIRDVGEEQRALAESLQDALNNIKVLKALLPICANCKKIRDGEGDWHPIDSYISQHSDTKFSHGICPQCVKKLYPEFGEMKLEKPSANTK